MGNEGDPAAKRGEVEFRPSESPNAEFARLNGQNLGAIVTTGVNTYIDIDLSVSRLQLDTIEQLAEEGRKFQERFANRNKPESENQG